MHKFISITLMGLALSVSAENKITDGLFGDGMAKECRVEAAANHAKVSLAKDEDFALSAQKAGLSYPELIQRLISLAPAEEGS